MPESQALDDNQRCITFFRLSLGRIIEIRNLILYELRNKYWY